jgi:hypothetical protein
MKTPSYESDNPENENKKNIFKSSSFQQEPVKNGFGEGIIDYLERKETESTDPLEAMKELSESIIILGGIVGNAADDLSNLLNDPTPNIDQKKKISYRIAEAEEEFVTRNRLRIPIFSKHLANIINSLGKRVNDTFKPRLDQSQREELLDIRATISSFSNSVSLSQTSVVKLRNLVANLAPLTSRENNAKIAVIEVLDNYLDNIANATHSLPDIQSNLELLLKE